jgi:chemotaxis protein methyltransferase CheR
MTLSAQEFAYVSDLVRRSSAIVLESGKEYLVEARLLPLARQAGLPSVSEYVHRAQHRPEPDMHAKIVDALTTNETSWFRDGEPFQALSSTVLPDLMPTRSANRSLRIWSAACSSGQEPYTLAMLLQDFLPAGWSYEIMATDISQEMLTRAEAGKFSQLEINRGLPAPMLVRHFERDGANWRVSAALRRSITFRRLNLAATLPPMPQFDVVFLRNVLIYFDVDTKRQVLQRISSQMKPDSWLFLGAAETTIGIDDRFERVAAGRSSAYRLRGARSASGGAQAGAQAGAQPVGGQPAGAPVARSAGPVGAMAPGAVAPGAGTPGAVVPGAVAPGAGAASRAGIAAQRTAVPGATVPGGATGASTLRGGLGR